VRDRVAAPLESGRERGRELAIVFEEQELHAARIGKRPCERALYDFVIFLRAS
jgi:hypothetical protein